MDGGFTIDDFTANEAAGTVTGPAGISRPSTARRHVIFGAACRGCPLRARCPTSQDGPTSPPPHNDVAAKPHVQITLCPAAS